jgi:pimeloyl-ACP methyl ester carboxylesterase
MDAKVGLQRVETNGVTLRVAVAGEGPLVVLVHGWPELWYSWRHQIGPLAAAGFRVVAPDVRGYGGSDKPHEVEAYDMRTLTSDVAGLIDAFGADQAEIEYFAEAFEKGGFRGPLNRYRCLQRDWEDLLELEGATIRQPSFFIAGSRDPVRHFVPGMDLYADPGAFCDDFRGNVLVEGEGHWVQQEAPDEVTRALLGFLEGL